jgi:mRNA-degrading endonuclease toxin of MazEF toxin-antitoxin module
VRRGEVYAHASFPRRFAVVSTDRIGESGTVVVAEIVPEAVGGVLAMFAVTLGAADPVPGTVLAWRLNYLAAGRLGRHLGQLSQATMDIVDIALRTALEL